MLTEPSSLEAAAMREDVVTAKPTLHWWRRPWFPWWWRQFFSPYRCAHEWKTIDSVIMSSPCEIAKENGADIILAQISESPGFFSETSILWLQCKNCGKLDKMVTRSMK